MKILKAILGFFKNLFGFKGDGDCDNCEAKDVCQTTDKTKKYAVLLRLLRTPLEARLQRCPRMDFSFSPTQVMVGSTTSEVLLRTRPMARTSSCAFTMGR